MVNVVVVGSWTGPYYPTALIPNVSLVDATLKVCGVIAEGIRRCYSN